MAAPMPTPMGSPLRHMSTAELVTELMTRYDEVLIIGCKLTSSAGPVIDIRSKLEKHTNMGSALIYVLNRIQLG